MAFGLADRDRTGQIKTRTGLWKGSVGQIMGHHPGCHFPTVTGHPTGITIINASYVSTHSPLFKDNLDKGWKK